MLTPGRVRGAVYALFSAAVTAGVFGYLFTHVSPDDVLETVRDADPRWIGVFILLSLAMSIFRTWRYGLILGVSGHAPGNAALFLTVLVRNLFSDLLPARIGALVYVYIVTGRLGIPFGAAASSFALSFLFDLMAIAPMIAAASLWVGAGMSLSAPRLLAFGATLVAAVGAFLHWLPALTRLAGKTLARLRLAGPARRARWCAAVADAEIQIVRARESGVHFRLFMLSVGVRAAKYAALYALLLGLLLPLGYRWREVSAAKVFLAICSSEAAASTPFSGIAGFGVYEGVWAAVFALLGFPARIARLTSISHHLLTQIFGYSLGALALLALLLPLFRARGATAVPTRNGGPAVVFYGRLLALALATALTAAAAFGALNLLRGARAAETGDANAPRPLPAAADGPPDPAALRAATAAMRGRIVFDSSRGNGFGVFSMRPDGTDIRALFDAETSDIFPDPSPDGRLIVFARAMSPHRNAPSAVWICRRDGSGAKKLADDGTFPTFAADGRTVYFERNRKKVMAADVEGRNEREVFPGADQAFASHAVVKPRVSPDGRFAAFISDRKGRWNTWVAELGTAEAMHLGAGCEPAWFPDSRRVAWVRERGARQGAGLFVRDPRGGEASELHDAGPPLGHEYFPTVSRDGRFLLWSACPEGQHAHESANYQIFAKDLASGAVARLTRDAYCNRWPKLLPDKQ